jgi:hypothetical protein
MNSLRPLILITPCYYSPVVMDMFTYFVSLELSCNYTKVKNKIIISRLKTEKVETARFARMKSMKSE